MKKVILSAFLLVMATCILHSKSNVVTDSLYSGILECYRPYNICLPDSYQENSSKVYPVMYLLHGAGGTFESWQKLAFVDDVLDYLVTEGNSCEMIIVMPQACADTEKAQRGYFNYPQWRYEDFFFQEFIPEVEKKYRIAAQKESRAIAGLSMGGGGAIAYAEKHPELFCAVYAMSALVSNPKYRVITPDMEVKRKAWLTTVIENDCTEFVSKAPAEIKEQLKDIAWFIDCGDDDHLLEVNLEFAQELRKAGIPFELRVREGGHKWEYWRSALRICLPYITRQFGR